MKKKVIVVELNRHHEQELIDLSEKLGIDDINETQNILVDIFYAYVTDSNLEMFKNFIKGKYKR